MTTAEVREKYLKFFEERGHKIIPSASLVPEDDPTTLFTGSGMQPMLSYLLGEPHPLGTRIADSQKCFRAQDIEEVGDNRHTTFFEMLGNWSLGDYFKEEQLAWLFEFLTQELQLDPKRLYVTVIDRSEKIPRDDEAVDIWKRLFKSVAIEAKDVENVEEKGLQGGRIFYYDAEKNWWSRVGVPDNMPPGEPGGPTSEVFYDFGAELGLHEQSIFKDKPCHVNCDCGRFFEIGNSVFMTYRKRKDGSIEELSQKNIDFGGGLERLVAATESQPDMFKIDSFAPIIKQIEKSAARSYQKEENKPAMQVIADHLKAATFLIVDRVKPSNKDQGYVLRRLLRRAAVKMHSLQGGLTPIPAFQRICHEVLELYKDIYFDISSDKETVDKVINQELSQFGEVLDRGVKQIQKQPLKQIDAKFVFDLYQSYGFPFEITQELLDQKGRKIDKEKFEKEFEKHREISRRGAKKKFAGGLADHSAETIKLHTATHLLHQALRDVLGEHVRQHGSNITADRLRFDFSHSERLSRDEIERVEGIINQKIEQDLDVWSEILSKEEALKLGALAFFGEKYADKVSVYFIGKEGKSESSYSKEFCGGPHVSSTRKLGKFKIVKGQSAGAGIRRIYAKLE